jgi:hypothetical protein
VEYARFLPLIDKQVQADVDAVLRRIDPALVPFGVTQLRLGEIKDFSGLATASQVQGVAIAEVNAGTAAQKALAREVFGEVSDQIIQRTSSR